MAGSDSVVGDVITAVHVVVSTFRGLTIETRPGNCSQLVMLVPPRSLVVVDVVDVSGQTVKVSNI